VAGSAIALTRAAIDGSSGTLAIALPFAAIDGSTAPGGSAAVAPRLAGRTGGIGALASALISARTLDVLGAEPIGPLPGIMALPAIASLMLGALLTRQLSTRRQTAQNCVVSAPRQFVSPRTFDLRGAMTRFRDGEVECA
jgi:hypothetical protein